MLRNTRLVVLCAAFVLFGATGCPFFQFPGSDNGTEGQVVEGQIVEGQAIEGVAEEGATVEGETSEGQAVEGQVAEGQIVEGQIVEGQIVEGQIVEGDSEDGEMEEGEDVEEGELSAEGEVIEGYFPEGEVLEGAFVEGEIVIEGQPLEGQPLEGQPLEGEPLEGQPLEGQPLEGQPLEGQPLEGQPLEGQPLEGQPLEGQPLEGQPLEGEPLEGQPLEGQPLEGQPLEGETISGAVSVSLSPAQAAGAQWRIDGGEWVNSGQVMSGVAAGDHLVSFKLTPGWIAPLSQSITVDSTQQINLTATYTAQLLSNQYTVLAYNDLGMHCMNQDFSEFMILPPYNTVHATVIRTGGEDPYIVTSGVTVTYELPTNTTSVDKTNFWDYAQDLFGLPSPLAPDMGLAGAGLSGNMTYSAASGRSDWGIDGIPVTPIEDDGTENAYPLATVTVKVGGLPIAQTQAVVPVSWEISCNLCHTAGSGLSVAGKILRSHDLRHDTDLQNEKPVSCFRCHAQAALGAAGEPGIPSLSSAMHSSHSGRMARLDGQLAETCYACHPGIRTQCLRDRHYAKGIGCTDCHGDMTAVGDSDRRPWVDEPRCADCHQSRKPTYQFEQAGTLFRNSKGHMGIQCSACHGSPHAITPTVKDADNMQATALQGHAGTINTCSVCHPEPPNEAFPHRLTDD